MLYNPLVLFFSLLILSTLLPFFLAYYICIIYHNKITFDLIQFYSHQLGNA